MAVASGSFAFQSGYIKSARGVKLFTCSWLPANQEVKALVFLCHGYGVECSIFMRGTGTRLAQAGYAVFGIDYEGHGKSEGAVCLVERFSDVVDDCSSYFRSIREMPDYKNKARFLYGESMGGAVALLIHRKEPMDWNGAVLVAPMCKISEKLKPHPVIVSILTRLSPLIKSWKIVPSKNIIDHAFKDPIKRDEIRANPYVYQDKPRVQTALQMMVASTDLEQRLDEVTFPFLVVHGEEDTVTDPACSVELHKRARSTDKTLNLYPEMWHGLTVGESDENIERVFADIVAWLNLRSPAGALTAKTLQQSDLKMVIDDHKLTASNGVCNNNHSFN
ncbi:caffeoylshikimate esterase [Selaginella moellendorffii]|uniref:caffeoylshikimate esterase n=2 Tax=Selaginella moellendorffii TaxID=88036 RepID=UPI000D1C7A8C|nr:caffeoylshikimate esterase [Selaginella moellendorffii]|eukprot:XP_002991748.2 caffeoylshikimate esterase [Selaginella moellendorffii]